MERGTGGGFSQQSGWRGWLGALRAAVGPGLLEERGEVHVWEAELQGGREGPGVTVRCRGGAVPQSRKVAPGAAVPQGPRPGCNSEGVLAPIGLTRKTWGLLGRKAKDEYGGGAGKQGPGSIAPGMELISWE